MFTGIIESLGEIKKIESEGTNKHFTLNCGFTNELKIDQSLAHNGVCLTVIAINGDEYTVTAIEETLERTNMNQLKIGDEVNLERCMKADGRFDGHIVQGHVDTVGICSKVVENDGSWDFYFTYNDNDNTTVEKGSITINGTSLTVCDSEEGMFSVSIIPYTYENTIFKNLKIGDKVNLEFDIIGKYVQKMLSKVTPSF